MVIPDLDNLINSLKCKEWGAGDGCKHCPYGYQYYDDSGDHGIWTCDEERRYIDILFYLEMYRLAIKEHENEND